jgi:predicted NAD/FAD-binding protein
MEMSQDRDTLKDPSYETDNLTPLLNYHKARHEADSQSVGKISITFDMNRLQAIPKPGEPDSPGRVLVSMNPIRSPRSPHSTQIYYHPIIDSDSVIASRKFAILNAAPNISFAGAWMGYGFHEDGFVAGMQVAKKIITGEYENLSSLGFGVDLAECVPELSLGHKVVRLIVGSTQFVIESKEWLFG